MYRSCGQGNTERLRRRKNNETLGKAILRDREGDILKSMGRNINVGGDILKDKGRRYTGQEGGDI